MKKSYKKELLDADFIPTADLIRNLEELKFINTYLGGHDVIKKGLKTFDNSKSLRILEIGSGGGDNLLALKNKYPQHQYFGLDIKQVCIDYSKAQSPEIEWILSDYKDLNQEFDIIFNSLFCHHFGDDALVEMLKWMNKNSKIGFFIGDLHRHVLAYSSIKFLTGLFSKSYLVKNDAPLSVKRGFTKKEWFVLLQKAGIQKYNLSWRWAFRHLLIVEK